MRKYLLWIGALALLLRLGAVFLATDRTQLGRFDDDGDHMRFGRTLVEHGVYASGPLDSNALVYRAFRAPAFSLFVAFVYKLHGLDNILALRLYLAILSMAVPFLMFRMGRRLFDDRVGLAAFVWGAFHPPFLYYAIHVQGDSFFYILATLAMTELMFHHNIGSSLRSGALLGLACLGRFHFIGSVAAGYAWDMVRPQIRPYRRYAQVLLLGCVILFLPWWVRNYAVLKTFIPFTTEGGVTLWTGNNDLTEGGGDCYDSNPPPGLNERELDRWHYQEAKKYIKTHPRRTIQLAVSKLSRFWGPVPRVGSWPLRLAVFAANLPMFVFCCVGLWVYRRRLWDFGPYLGLALYYTAVHTLYPSVMRYRLPLEPFMLTMASAALIHLTNRRLQ